MMNAPRYFLPSQLSIDFLKGLPDDIRIGRLASVIHGANSIGHVLSSGDGGIRKLAAAPG
jgi:hypothetical protein